MPFPINTVHRLLLESGSLILLEDNTSKVILDEVIALDDPLTGGTPSTTPSLTFAGENLAGQMLSYEVQVDTVSTFDTNGAAGSVTAVDSYNEANQGTTTVIDTGSRLAVGQSFNAGSGGVLNSAKWYLIKTGTPTGYAYAKIYEHSGVYGTSSVPTGVALAVSDPVDISQLSTSVYALYTFTFSGANKISLTSGQKYVVSIETPYCNSSNTISVGRGADTGGGNWSDFQPGVGWSAASTIDNVFYVYVDGTESVPLLSKKSSLDLGFTDDITLKADDKLLLESGFNLLLESGSKTVLNYNYPSGNEISYVPGVTLSAGTQYFWRVRSFSWMPSTIFNPAITLTYASNSSFTPPDSVTSVFVEAWAGGGAAGGNNASNVGGGGGGGGAYSSGTVTVTPGLPYTINVGAGGVGVAGADGGAGTDSWFGTTATLLAKGGGAGLLAGTAGSGGASGSGVGTVKFSGGAGGAGGGGAGGGGGGGAGSTGVGGAAGNASGGLGGSAGSGTAVGGGAGATGQNNGTGFAGAAGSNFGGAGSGSSFSASNTAGGNGAPGQIKITYTRSFTRLVKTTSAWSETRSFTPTSGGTVLTKTQPAIARIANTKTVTQPAVARIAKNITKTQPAIARIAQTLTKTQPAIARIAIKPTKTQPAIARVANTPTKAQPAIARIQKAVVKTQPAIARIANNVTKTQPSIARISKTFTKTQTATAHIRVIVTKTQPAVARIQNLATKTQSATARIANTATLTKTQPAIARIANNVTKTQPVTARIANVKTKTQPAVARISKVFTKTQPAIARIQKAVVKTQPAVGRISNIETKTQPAIARISKTFTKTQSATASITSSRGFRCWNGSQWVIILPKVWNGAAWVRRELWHWDGVRWK